MAPFFVCVLLLMTAGSLQAQDASFLDLLNQARVEQGNAIIYADATLQQVAQSQADHMATIANMTHDGADGSSVLERVQRRGYDGNISQLVYRHPDSKDSTAVNALRLSPAHMEVLFGDFIEAGIARVKSPVDDLTYWCIVLGKPTGSISNDRDDSNNNSDDEVASAANEASPPIVPDVEEVDQTLNIASNQPATDPIITQQPGQDSSNKLSPFTVIVATLAIAGAGYMIYLAYQTPEPKQDIFRRR